MLLNKTAIFKEPPTPFSLFTSKPIQWRKIKPEIVAIVLLQLNRFRAALHSTFSPERHYHWGQQLMQDLVRDSREMNITMLVKLTLGMYLTFNKGVSSHLFLSFLDKHEVKAHSRLWMLRSLFELWFQMSGYTLFLYENSLFIIFGWILLLL